MSNPADSVRTNGTVPHGGRRRELTGALRDPERLAAALPHVEDFALGPDGEFAAIIRPSLGLGEVPVRTRWRPAGPLVWDVSGASGENRITLTCAVEVDDQAAHWTIECHTTGALRAMTQRTLAAILDFYAVQVIRAALNAGGGAGSSSVRRV